MIARSSLALMLGALLGSTAMLAPPAAFADPAAATVPDASSVKPAAPAAPATAAGSTSTTATPAPSTAADGIAKKPATASKPSEDEMRARRRADRDAFFSAHLAALQAGLSLQPDQQALWQPVETAIRDVAKVRAERWRMHHQDMSGRDASRSRVSDNKASDSVDTLQAQGENMTRMGTAIQSLARATAPLLASLTTEQKNRLPPLVEGLKPHRLIARAFNLEDDGAMDGLRGRRGFDYGQDWNGRNNGDKGDLMFNRDGHRGSMQGERDGDDQARRFGEERGFSHGRHYGQSDGMSDQHRSMPQDEGNE